MRLWVQCKTFDMGDMKDSALKPLEEASEAREAVERWCEHAAETDESGAALRHHAVYECCDTLQATCNLLAALGVDQQELDRTMAKVRAHNEERGRHGR